MTDQVSADPTQLTVSDTLREINNQIRQALADESISSRVQELLELYRRTEAGLDILPSPLVAAAVRFRDACDISTKRTAEGVDPSNAEMIEMEQATLRLIYATNTTTIGAALDVLGDFES
jgi:hypothetical protein